MSVAKIIIVLSHVPIVVVALYALFNYGKLGKELKLFSWFTFISFLVQAVSLALWFGRINNFFLLHLYVPLGFFSLALFYSEVLKAYVSRRVIIIAAGSFVFLSLLNTLLLQALNTFNSYALTLECILVIILSLSTYMIFLNDAVKESHADVIKSINWINSGFFIYYSSAMVIFYFGDLFTRYFPAQLNRYTWVLHSFFSVIMYLCFFIGLWKRPAR